MRALLALAISAAALTAPQNNVEVTLKLALDRNGAVDDLDLVAREVEDAELVQAREPLDPLHVVAVEVEDVELGERVESLDLGDQILA